uniref:RNA 3'-terminal phosphate cyclase insert domain-containing protein n=1 Tax=Ananas comosus var. bracteatus TaxID=296719 RepID=A0A6V7NE16_ANACO|nr:unnamed protein product [Ananas comosus var. bracteatus]
MGKTRYMRLRGSRHLRQRLVLATLTATPIVVEEIHSDDTFRAATPRGLPLPPPREDHRPLVRRVRRKRDGVAIQARGFDRGKEPRARLRFEPLDRVLPRAADTFGAIREEALSIRLKEGLELKIESRGAPPLGGGEVLLRVPIIPNTLTATHWVDEGMMFIFSPIIDLVGWGRSPGYGISLVAETTTGCLISADITSFKKVDEMDEDIEEKPEVKTPEDIGVEVASMLLGEIKRGE